MISVKKSLKKFWEELAVDDISFEVKKGEVLVFLGRMVPVSQLLCEW